MIKTTFLSMLILSISCVHRTSQEDNITQQARSDFYVKQIRLMQNPVAVITSKATDLNQYIGKAIVVRGPISNTKIPQIFGIEISCRFDQRNKVGEAVGILQRYKVTRTRDDMASFGPGTYYRLFDPRTRSVSKVE